MQELEKLKVLTAYIDEVELNKMDPKELIKSS